MNRTIILIINTIMILSLNHNCMAQANKDLGIASVKEHNWLYLGNGKKMKPDREETINCDVAVVGAGMAGICAAVAAARQGSNVVLINDRPVLGGNASSEIRVTVNGVQTLKAKNQVERETGIIEEILLENRKYNPQNSYSVWDHVLLDYVTRQERLTLLLNTQALKAITKGSKIKSAICWQSSTETQITINAKLFIDCSGDGLFAATSGAEYRTGREGKDEFGEKYAPDKSDGWVMGESIMMITKDMGVPTPFYPPSFTRKFNYKDAVGRDIKQFKEGYWWVELGSSTDIIKEREKNSHALLGYLYGVWDYIKNSGKFPETINLALDWVGSLPGKRESRRFMGDYILNENDLLNYKHFDDCVAYGGWSLDEHCPGGILSLDQKPSYFHERFSKIYEIPFRSLYSKNISNLMFAGRNISVSHMALSSTRIIATCSLMGQAAGVAAAMCVEKNANPRDIYRMSISELQQRMLREDYFIPYVKSNDNKDLAPMAESIAVSSTSSGKAEYLIDGIARDINNEIHHWQSEGLNETVNLKWKSPVDMSSVEIKFDTNLNRQIMMHKNPDKYVNQIVGIPPELVKSFSVEVLYNNEWTKIADIDNNIHRLVKVKFKTQKVKEIRITLRDTYGSPQVKLFEVRCY